MCRVPRSHPVHWLGIDVMWMPPKAPSRDRVGCEFLQKRMNDALLSLFKGRLREDSTVSVCANARGIAVAEVRRDDGVPPSLALCDFAKVGGVTEQHPVLQRLVKKHDLDRSRCVSSLDIGDYSLLSVEPPDVHPTELSAALRWRVKDLIDFSIDDAVIDAFEVSNELAPGRKRVMYTVVARAGLVKERADQLLDADLKLSAIDIPELAMRNVAALLPEDVGGVVLIYLSGDGGLITVTRQSQLYLSRLIGTGSGSVAPAGDLSAGGTTTQAWLDGIVIEIQRSMDYYESHFSQPPVSSLVVAPLERPIPGIAEYISQQLNVSTRVLDVNALIDSTQPLTEDLQSRCFLAIGSALRVEGQTP